MVIFVAILIYNSFTVPAMIGTTYDVLVKSVPMGSILLGGVLFFTEERGYVAFKSNIWVAISSLLVFTIAYDCLRDKTPVIMVSGYYLLATITFLSFKNLSIVNENKILMRIADNSYWIYLLHSTLYMVGYSFLVQNGKAYRMVLHTFILGLTAGTSFLLH